MIGQILSAEGVDNRLLIDAAELTNRPDEAIDGLFERLGLGLLAPFLTEFFAVFQFVDVAFLSRHVFRLRREVTVFGHLRGRCVQVLKHLFVQQSD